MAHIHSLADLTSTAHAAPFVELRQSLASQVEAISALADQVMLFIAIHREADGSELEIEMALCEALANAVIHGNRENPKKRVYVICRCSADGEVSITIRDQGLGFDTRSVPDPIASERFFSPHGRGIYLMRKLMDEVCFEEGGSVVHMRKKSSIGSAGGRPSETGS